VIVERIRRRARRRGRERGRERWERTNPAAGITSLGIATNTFDDERAAVLSDCLLQTRGYAPGYALELELLDVSSTAIRERGMRELTRLVRRSPRLDTISLWLPGVDDSAASALAGMIGPLGHASVLMVDGTHMTDAGMMVVGAAGWSQTSTRARIEEILFFPGDGITQPAATMVMRRMAWTVAIRKLVVFSAARTGALGRLMRRDGDHAIMWRVGTFLRGYEW